MDKTACAEWNHKTAAYHYRQGTSDRNPSLYEGSGSPWPGAADCFFVPEGSEGDRTGGYQDEDPDIGPKCKRISGKTGI